MGAAIGGYLRCWLYHIAAATSLLLCVATVALRVRACWVNDIVGGSSHSVSWDCDSWHGRLMFHVTSMRQSSPISWWPRPAMSTDRDSPAFTRTWWNRVGFVYLTESYPPMRDVFYLGLVGPLPRTIHSRYVAVPTLFVAMLFAVWPAARLWCYARSPRRQFGRLCCSCGYDLRATPERCPECGGVPKNTRNSD